MEWAIGAALAVLGALYLSNRWGRTLGAEKVKRKAAEKSNATKDEQLKIAADPRPDLDDVCDSMRNNDF
jgi:hypothetical protein